MLSCRDVLLGYLCLINNTIINVYHTSPGVYMAALLIVKLIFFYSVWKVGMLEWGRESRNQSSNIILLITDLSKPNQRKCGLSQSNRVYPLQHNPQFHFPCCLGLIKAPFWCRRVPKVHAWIIPPPPPPPPPPLQLKKNPPNTKCPHTQPQHLHTHTPLFIITIPAIIKSQLSEQYTHTHTHTHTHMHTCCSVS